jgi:C-terminal processing protease CtpA/Prc
MKIRTVISWFSITILSIGASYYFQNPTEEKLQTPAKPETLDKVITNSERDVPSAILPQPEPVQEPVTIETDPAKNDAVARTNAERMRKAERYWQQHAQNFDRQLARLSQEKNPDQRNSLIQSIARYVRMDTLSVIDWAMGLQDPDERKAALSAINKNALNGIGARIEVDETGLPKIQETTILSAIDSSGLVEPGDYISGMVNADGSVVQFKDLSLQQVVQSLRGKPGTKTRLMMERISPDGVPYYFDVPIQRSLIVVQPPF